MEENNQNVLPTEAEKISKSCCGSCDKKSCWKWIFIVALLFLTASLAYAGYQFSQFSKLSQKQAVISQPTPVAQSSPTPTTDPTANWKTWTISDKSKFLQYKYPNEWKYYTDTAGVGYDDTGNGYYGINIGFQNNNKQLPLEEFVNTISDSNQTAKKLPASIGNKKGIQIDNYLNGTYYSVIYCEYDDKTILEIDASGNTNKNQEILTKILSTFRFD